MLKVLSLLMVPLFLAGLTQSAGAVSDSVGPGVALAHAARAAEPVEGCHATERGYRCYSGPVDVPSGEMVEVNDFVAAPPEPGYLTSMRATLVDKNGDRIAHHMVHLHHAVWINPNKTDSTCPSFGGFPNWDRFFATGKERTRVALPEGYGYFWDNQGNSFSENPFWALTAHLDGMHGAGNVFIRLNLGFTPLPEGDGLTDIDPVWLDVMNCTTNPVFDVQKGSGTSGIYKKRWSYTMPAAGNFISFGGHLHDGGFRLALWNRTTGLRMFTSKAIYGMKSEPWYLTKMTSFAGLPGLGVGAGDELELVAIYDSTHNWHDAMGIMVGAFVPSQ